MRNKSHGKNVTDYRNVHNPVYVFWACPKKLTNKKNESTLYSLPECQETPCSKELLAWPVG